MVVRVHPPGTVVPQLSAGSAAAGTIEETDLLAVWKPTLGERPLFDFPLGTLTRREVAAFLVSEAFGWSIVPPTLLREGPYGEGMVQQWIDVDPAVDVVALVTQDDPRLRRIAVFDAAVNNTDRKGGHLLPVPGGHLYAVDHGVTFSTVPKLRTLLWAWEGQPFDTEELAGLRRVEAAIQDPDAASLGGGLRELLAADEIEATRERVASLLAVGRFPGPNPEWPAIPWPPF
ncbi:MAG TPA: SCO1664 family protein [Candidatus Eisenbacteria bacterium]|nr:SCO1664 family protein [Candidatus Eisenbacteria bacterium]